MLKRKIIIFCVIILFFSSMIFNASAINIEISNVTSLEDITCLEDIDNYKRWHHIKNDEEFKESKEFSNNKNIIPGEIIVQFKNKLIYTRSTENQILTGIPSLDKLNEEFGVHDVKQLLSDNNIPSLQNLYVLNCTMDINPATIAKIYNEDPNVIIAEPNYIYEYNIQPNDPKFYQQWALFQHNDKDIDATDAWDITTGSSNVVIAVIDSGIDRNHPDLKNNIISGWNFISDSSITSDFVGHGTFCSGIIAAQGNNNKGIAGVTWNSKIMPLKTGNIRGSYLDLSIEAICYAADHKVDVISISWGSSVYSKTLEEAINYAHFKGVVIVAAAGNDYDTDKHYPAAFENVIAVAGTDQDDDCYYYSNYGSWIDVAAPAEDILSTYPIASYRTGSGTSFSAPLVAGVAALILSENPSLTPDMVKTKIRNGVDTLDTKENLGTGRINAHKALTMEPVYTIITPILDWTDIKGTLKIEGTASCENFKSYTIEYSKGRNPNSWVTIKTSVNPVINDELALLNTEEILDGIYLIKLKLETTNGDIYTDTLMILVNNIEQQTIYVDAKNTEGPWDGTEQYPYKQIYEGIDSVTDDETVVVKKGTYYPYPDNNYGYRKGNFIIDRSIRIQGEDQENTIVSHEKTQKKWMFDIIVDNVEISGLKIQTQTDDYDWKGGAIRIRSNDNYIHDNIISTIEGGGAIYLERSSGNIIEDNLITSEYYSDSWRGICLGGFCYDNKIIGNTITRQFNCGIGLWEGCQNNLVEENIIKEGPGSGTCYGIILMDWSDKNTVRNNEIRDTKTHSYYLQQGGMVIETASENMIQNNIFADSKGNGIWIWFWADKNIVANNVFENNQRYGIHVDHSWIILFLFEPPILCKNNIFYANSFKNNELGNARDDGSNTWYKINNGNCWDDYKGSDRNNDGIGDTPYIIPGYWICIQLGFDPEDTKEILRIPITHRDRYPIIEESDDNAKSIRKPVLKKFFEENFYSFLKLFLSRVLIVLRQGGIK